MFVGQASTEFDSLPGFFNTVSVPTADKLTELSNGSVCGAFQLTMESLTLGGTVSAALDDATLPSSEITLTITQSAALEVSSGDHTVTIIGAFANTAANKVQYNVEIEAIDCSALLKDDFEVDYYDHLAKDFGDKTLTVFSRDDIIDDVDERCGDVTLSAVSQISGPASVITVTYDSSSKAVRVSLDRSTLTASFSS